MSDGIFAGMRPVRPPDEMKKRVLRVARVAGAPNAVAGRSGLGLTRFDLVWAAALMLLVACHAGLSLRGRSAERVGKSASQVGSDRIADKELAGEAGIVEFRRIEGRDPARTAQPMTMEHVLRVVL
jgi:hypothetical protein